MGLRQEAETSFGNQSDRLLPHRSLERLSWFDTQTSGFSISRRSFLTGGLAAAAAFMLTEPVSAESPVNVDKEQLLSEKITGLHARAIKEFGDEFNITGVQLSRVFKDEKDSVSVVYQTGIFTLDGAGNLVVSSAISAMEQAGYDTHSIPRFLGDAVPSKGLFNEEITDQVRQTADTLGKIMGFSAVITGVEDFGDYTGYRIGDGTENGDKIGLVLYTKGEQTGLLRLAHTGHLVFPAKIVARDVMLAQEELATGGGTTETQPGLVFETLQSGKGKQTEWVIQKSPDSPITPVVQRPDALALVADTNLPKGNLKKVKINFLPAFEGYGMYNGLDFSSQGTSIPVTDSIYGPAVFFKVATVQHDDTLKIYCSPSQEKGYESLPIIQQGGQDELDKVNNGISVKIGELITEAGGYNWRLTGRQAPEAWAMGLDDNKSAAIKLVLS